MYVIKTKNLNDDLRILLISDLHLGNKLSDINYLYMAYEYALNNDIKYVINIGDVIESVMPHNKNNLVIYSVLEQVEYVIDKYPKVDSIKSLILYGNHDYYSTYCGSNIDVAGLISTNRKDIYNLGYGENFIRIVDNYLKLNHEISYLKDYKHSIGTFINILGHLHGYRVRSTEDSIYINVPSLSYVSPNNLPIVPMVLDVNLCFYNEMISKVEIKSILIEDNMIASSLECGLNINPKKFVKIKEGFDKLYL